MKPAIAIRPMTPDDYGAVLCGHDGRRGYLHHLAVAPDWRGRRVARRLLDACFRALDAHEILECNIFLFAENAGVAAFWLHDGWLARGDLRVLQKFVAPAARALS